MYRPHVQTENGTIEDASIRITGMTSVWLHLARRRSLISTLNKRRHARGFQISVEGGEPRGHRALQSIQLRVELR